MLKLSELLELGVVIGFTNNTEPIISPDAKKRCGTIYCYEVDIDATKYLFRKDSYCNGFE